MPKDCAGTTQPKAATSASTPLPLSWPACYRPFATHKYDHERTKAARDSGLFRPIWQSRNSYCAQLNFSCFGVVNTLKLRFRNYHFYHNKNTSTELKTGISAASRSAYFADTFTATSGTMVFGFGGSAPFSDNNPILSAATLEAIDGAVQVPEPASLGLLAAGLALLGSARRKRRA